MNPFCCASVEDTLEINGDSDAIVGEDESEDDDSRRTKEKAEDSSSDDLSDSAEKVVLDIFEKIGAHRGDLEPLLGTRKGVTFEEKVDLTPKSTTAELVQEDSVEIQTTHPKSPEDSSSLPSLLPNDDQSQELKPETVAKEDEIIATEAGENNNPQEEDTKEEVAEDDVETATSDLEKDKIVEIQNALPKSQEDVSTTQLLTTTNDDQSQELNQEVFSKGSPEAVDIIDTEAYESDNNPEHNDEEVAVEEEQLAEEESVDAEIEFVLKEPSTTDAEGGEDNGVPDLTDARLFEEGRDEGVSRSERDPRSDDKEQAGKSVEEDRAKALDSVAAQEDSLEANVVQGAEECLAPPESAFDLTIDDSGNVSGSEDFDDVGADLSNFGEMVPDEEGGAEEPVTLGSDIHEAAALALDDHGDAGREEAAVLADDDARPKDLRAVGNHVISAIALTSKSESPARDPASPAIHDVSTRPSSAKGKRRLDHLMSRKFSMSSNQILTQIRSPFITVVEVAYGHHLLGQRSGFSHKPEKAPRPEVHRVHHIYCIYIHCTTF